MIERKKIILLIIVLIIAGLALFFVNLPVKKETPKALGVPGSKTEIERNQLPEKIPSGLVLEPQAEILENFQITVGDESQSTRQYVTQESLEKNYNDFQKYLTANGWKILSMADQKTVKAISAQNLSGDRFNITISYNSITKQNVVDISVTYRR